MKVLAFSFVIISHAIIAQSTDREEVNRVCMDYIDAFYNGDTAKLMRSFRPSVYKFGYLKDKTSGAYKADGQMTYKDAFAYSKNVLASGRFKKPTTVRKVEILDVMDHLAAAKITAWWGVDYVLLSKHGGTWMIEQVLWEGPLATIAKVP